MSDRWESATVGDQPPSVISHRLWSALLRGQRVTRIGDSTHRLSPSPIPRPLELPRRPLAPFPHLGPRESVDGIAVPGRSWPIACDRPRCIPWY